MARIIHFIASTAWDSEALYALNLCVGFSNEGVSTLVYTRDAKVVDEPFRKAGIEIRHSSLGGYLDIPAAVRISRDLRHEPDDTVIHVHHYHDAFTALLARKLARRKDIRVVYTRHKIRRGADTPLVRRIYRNLDAQIFISRLARDRFLSTWKKEYPFDPGRLHIVLNSIRRLNPEPAPMRDKGPVMGMYYGTLEPGKGLEILIDALHRLREVKGRLRIVGSGKPDYVDSLRRRAQARGVMDLIEWRRDSGDADEFIRDSHFGVMPSVAPEPFGVTNLFFLAAGRPIIATSNGAQTEYLTNGRDALLVPPANAAALGDALANLGGDRELCRAMGRSAFDTFSEALLWKRFFRRLKAIYFPNGVRPISSLNKHSQ